VYFLEEQIRDGHGLMQLDLSLVTYRRFMTVLDFPFSAWEQQLRNL